MCRTLGVPVARLQRVRSARLLPLRLLSQLLLPGARGRRAGSLLPGRSPVLLGPRPGQPVGLRRQLGPAAQLRPQSRPGEGGAGGGAGRTGRAGHGVTPGKRFIIPQGWGGGLHLWLPGGSTATVRSQTPQGFCSESRVSGGSLPPLLLLLVPLHTAGPPPRPPPSASPAPTVHHSFFSPPVILVGITFPRLWEF